MTDPLLSLSLVERERERERELTARDLVSKKGARSVTQRKGLQSMFEGLIALLLLLLPSGLNDSLALSIEEDRNATRKVTVATGGMTTTYCALIAWLASSNRGKRSRNPAGWST